MEVAAAPSVSSNGIAYSKLLAPAAVKFEPTELALESLEALATGCLEDCSAVAVAYSAKPFNL